MRLGALGAHGGVCAGLLCLACRSAGPPPTTAFAPPAVRTRDGVSLAVFSVAASTRRAREQPLILVLHGGPAATHDYLRPEWDRLAGAGPVAYYDQRGCGLSERRGPYSWQQHVRDIEDVIARLAGDRPVVLAGSSWGAILALLYAQGHPGRVVAMVLSGVVPWQGRGATPHTRWDSLDAALVPHGVFREHDVDIPGPELPLAIRARSATAPSKFAVVCPHAGFWLESLTTAPSLAALRTIGAPVLLLAGSDTSTHPDGSPEVAAVLRHGTRVVLTGAGHDPWLDAPDDFFAAAATFLHCADRRSRRAIADIELKRSGRLWYTRCTRSH